MAGWSRAKGPSNEDAYFVDPAHQLFGVFDGLGSTSQAALAASLAAEGLRAAYEHQIEQGDPSSERSFLALAAQGAGALLASTLDDGLTTASVVKVCPSGGGAVTALVFNVGDSRVYRYDAAGELWQCTLDDSLFGADWELQRRLGEVVVPTSLLEVVYFQQRHVLDRTLGDGDPRVEEIEVGAGDVLLAVTDGVTDNLTFSELRQLLAGSRDEGAGEVARRVVEAARDRSHQASHPRAKVDDITAVVCRISGGSRALAGGV
jgi:serine/threonine protein phosphatase PrpC